MNKNVRILWADDDYCQLSQYYTNKLQTSIIKIANNINLALDFAFDGEMALAKMARNFYDLIIIDYNLPIYNGLDLISTIKSNLYKNEAFDLFNYDNLVKVLCTASSKIEIVANYTESIDQEKLKNFNEFNYFVQQVSIDEVIEELTIIIIKHFNH